ncbi:MAG: exodeoxyribonuclease III [Deltaproteobacteria bacterium]|nr:exodeoxyribonuclease III [Deltaproteobacteria bacterium]
MKIACWNVNSVRVRIGRLVEWLNRTQPDIVCLQETKCEDAQFPYEALGDAGYECAHAGQKTYNGVAVLSRARPVSVQRGFMDGGEEDAQRRLIWATFELPFAGAPRFTVCSAYAPNGQSVGSDKYAYKLAWFERLARVVEQKHEWPLVVCGDFNVAPADIDVHDPQAWRGQVLCSEAERAALQRVLASGLHDGFREKRPQDQAFTWWDYRMLGFQKNRGLRIDHMLLDARALAACTAVEVDREMRKGDEPSDHAPVVATFG